MFDSMRRGLMAWWWSRRVAVRMGRSVPVSDGQHSQQTADTMTVAALAWGRQGHEFSTPCILEAAWQIRQGVVVQRQDETQALDALMVAALTIAAQGHRVHLIILDGVDFAEEFSCLKRAGEELALRVAKISTNQAENQRRLAYRADITVCTLLQLLKDRTQDLLQWPLKPTASHLQFDQLYGRRSAARNRLLPDGVRALIHQADRVLIDQLALKITVGETGVDDKHRPAGAVHAFSLFKSYLWLGGSAGPCDASLCDVRELYGVPVVVRGVEQNAGVIVADIMAQAECVADLIVGSVSSTVLVEVLQDSLAAALIRVLTVRKIDYCVAFESEQNLHERVVVYRDRQCFEEHLADIGIGSVVIVTTSLDPAPGSIRRLKAEVDPNSCHKWLEIYSLDESLLARRLPSVCIRFTKGLWRPSFGRLLGPLVARLALAEERRQRLVFAASLRTHRKRFAFAPHWGNANE